MTGIDAGFTCRIRDNYAFEFIQDDFIAHSFLEQYDLVWCAHVLEHQLAVGEFIKKLFSCCKGSGKVAITVPDEKEGKVIEGHVNNRNFYQSTLLVQSHRRFPHMISQRRVCSYTRTE